MEERDLLFTAAVILAIRTARFDDREYEGMQSPRMRAAIYQSLALARMLRGCLEKEQTAPLK